MHTRRNDLEQQQQNMRSCSFSSAKSVIIVQLVIYRCSVMDGGLFAINVLEQAFKALILSHKVWLLLNAFLNHRESNTR